ncbi:hypothetical protein [Flexithrix dorotheae]|uniref:hypothetical protein n=1 Tax=Flexithrix dorotheae TaxID=70993 RepID=UPI0003A0A01F|nr:hypothetical protein [Flexithrix dorotheae]
MKTYLFIILLACIFVGCNQQKNERFNYTLIKSMIDVTPDQVEKFDAITSRYTTLGRETYDKFHHDKEKLAKELEKVAKNQDAEMQSLLSEAQYVIYEREIKIERKGREQHNMNLIKNALEMDSTQQVQFDRANEAFYTTLIDNHDNYHGKPDVYLEYYKELDVSRRAAFEEFMNSDQYNLYLKLVDEYKIGKSEH